MSTYEISKSSLLSLKAEILRKQEEFNKVKLQNKSKLSQAKKPTPLEIKNKGIEQREKNDINEEDENLLRKSRTALELKSKLYEKLSKRSNFTDEEIEHNRKFLVCFDKKKGRVSDLPPDDSDDSVDKYPESDEENHFSDDYESPKNPDEEWVEYIDCLGRTRKCMRKDLEFLKSKDAELRASVDKDANKAEQLSRPTKEPDTNDEDDSNNKFQGEFDEKNELLSSDMRRELLRQQWEEEEEELRKKDDIHYQDILFNEARTHGVGYYGFSKDEGERARQQDALKNLRQETEQQQKKAQELKLLREKQLAARAKAARNRKRARMGLPPEEDEPEVSQQLPEETVNEEKLKEKAEEEKKEKEKETARKKHIRPWDIGKEGVREHYEYTQEEWVDKKRKERPQEFAPPSAYKRSFRSTSDVGERDTESLKTLFFSTKKSNSTETSKESKLKNTLDKEETYKDNSDSVYPKNTSVNPYKSTETVYSNQNSAVSFEPVPIVNECEDFDDDQDRLLGDYASYQQSSNTKNSSHSDVDSNDSERGRGAEVAPPPTFEYYGPNSVKRSKMSKKENFEESITEGLKFLRQQAEKKDTSIKHSSEMFLL